MKNSIVKKILISLFIIFHWGCVLAWLMPKPSPIKSFLLSRRIGRHEIVATYLFNTAEWQDWGMFAPDPLQVNLYAAATVRFADGTEKEFGFPRLSQLNYGQAWIQKRYRKYQQQIVSEDFAGYRRDLARYIARRMNRDPANPPAKVTLYKYESPIPRHDRPEARRWTDYTALLRRQARFTPTTLLAYDVRPEDLR